MVRLITLRKLSDEEIEKAVRKAHQNGLDAEFYTEYACRVRNGEKVEKLETLRIVIPLGIFQEYHYHGFVKSVFEFVERLSEKYNDDRFLDSLLIKQETSESPPGVCLDFYTGQWPFRTKHVHVFYEHQDSEAENIFLKAHEETHALNHFGKIIYLERKIRKSGRKLAKRLKKLKIESRANIGGLYALLERRYSPEEIKETLPEHKTKELELF